MSKIRRIQICTCRLSKIATCVWKTEADTQSDTGNSELFPPNTKGFLYFCNMRVASAIMILFTFRLSAQLAFARDTITVLENGYVLKLPWAGGVNYANVSTIDLDHDLKKDLVIFDRQNQFSMGKFRCFLNRGSAGEIIY